MTACLHPRLVLLAFVLCGASGFVAGTLFGLVIA